MNKRNPLLLGINHSYIIIIFLCNECIFIFIYSVSFILVWQLEMFETLLLLCHNFCHVYDVVKLSVGQEDIQVYTKDLIFISERRF